MNGTQLIADILKQEGTEYLFCFPDNQIIDPCAEVGIRPMLARTERTVIAMADGYSRMTNGRKIGVAAVQHGPGAENSFGGVAQAFSDSTPLLFLPQQTGTHRLGQNPEFDSVVNYREITKWATRIQSPDRVASTLRRAYTYLRLGRPGPVLVETPRDLLALEITDESKLQYQPVNGARTAADPEGVRQAAALLMAAKRPVIHAGQGVLYAEATNELVELAELLSAPVMTTLPGKSGFPESHPLSLGSGGHSGPEALAQYLGEADLIFGIGTSMTSSLFAAPIPSGKRIIHSTIDDRDVNKDVIAECVLLGDAKLVLRQLIEAISGSAATSEQADKKEKLRSIERLVDLKRKTAEDWRPAFQSDEVPINPYRVIGELMDALDPFTTVITHDAGKPRDQLTPFWKSDVPRSFLGWGKSTHLGYGLGLALGAKLAAPEKTVVNVMGDCAIGMTGMDIETGVRLGIPILTIILNNSSMSYYEIPYPTASERYGFKYLSGNYYLMAQALGAWSARIDRPEDIKSALGSALAAMADGRPAVIEVISKEEPALQKPW
ncbi:MAG: thiamine pyrophosphate-requiring protein [Thermomicrobiales bacterium]|nr:thiamine pyrophosphate-requiring protein [Thermomicrobiales bacterium]